MKNSPNKNNELRIDRSAIAAIAGIKPKRFDVLGERGHTPFPRRPYQRYAITDAVLLRVQCVALEFLRPAEAKEFALQSQRLISDRLGSSDLSSVLTAADVLWIGGVDFFDESASEKTVYRRVWFCGPIDSFPEWMRAQCHKLCAVPLRSLPLVNVTECYQHVRSTVKQHLPNSAGGVW